MYKLISFLLSYWILKVHLFSFKEILNSICHTNWIWTMVSVMAKTHFSELLVPFIRDRILIIFIGQVHHSVKYLVQLNCIWSKIQPFFSQFSYLFLSDIINPSFHQCLIAYKPGWYLDSSASALCSLWKWELFFMDCVDMDLIFSLWI